MSRGLAIQIMNTYKRHCIEEIDIERPSPVFGITIFNADNWIHSAVVDNDPVQLPEFAHDEVHRLLWNRQVPHVSCEDTDPCRVLVANPFQQILASGQSQDIVRLADEILDYCQPNAFDVMP